MDKENKLGILRHSTAHILAAAVLEMFPEAKFGVGPAIEDGFYYDFDLPRTLIPEDLPILEEKMKKIIKANYPFEKQEIDIKKAAELFKKAGQSYKVELIKDIWNDTRKGVKRSTIKNNGLAAVNPKQKSTVSLYKTGRFVDLCLGPHIDSTGEIKIDAFKLLKIAGAYWKGDEKNKMLQRIYGTVFESKNGLDEYLYRLEEAEKRDHRKLGKDLNLFLIEPLVGMGLVLWQPKGALLWRIMEEFWYQEHLKNGYELVRTPHIGSRKLWETSGHWGFFSENMYPPLEVGQSLEETREGKKTKIKEEYLLKPMNCPFHVLIYNSRIRSYHELPRRWAENGTVYRYEKSGELSGLTRVRGFTQDDAHIICAKNQAKDELKKVVDFIIHMLGSFGFREYNVYLSLRDPNNKKKYAGHDEGWKFTEKILEEVAQEKKLNYKKERGEAAFYGPKLDFKIKDALGREWQCSTLQFDFNLPERFNMSFINEKGKKEKPYMLHRALFGSFERFIGVLLEHYAGALPLWLSPIQVEVIPVSEKFKNYGRKIDLLLKENSIRSQMRDANETLGKRIREAQQQKINYMLIVGEKEMKADNVAVRSREKGDLGTMGISKFIEKIKKQMKEKK
jgi:threonyl-tRNA synthetase